MDDSFSHYEARAEECMRFALITKDEKIKEVLLTLRQSSLGVAARLRNYEAGKGLPVGTFSSVVVPMSNIDLPKHREAEEIASAPA